MYYIITLIIIIIISLLSFIKSDWKAPIICVFCFIIIIMSIKFEHSRIKKYMIENKMIEYSINKKTGERYETIVDSSNKWIKKFIYIKTK